MFFAETNDTCPEICQRMKFFRQRYGKQLVETYARKRAVS